MSALTFANLQAIPQVLQLVVGVLGLVFSIRARRTGGTGLMVAAFVVMIVSTVGGLVWQYVALGVNDWIESGHLTTDEVNLLFTGVELPLGIAAAISWLLVALAIVARQRTRPFAPGNYGQPMAAPPGFAPAQPGYPQSGYPQPGYPQPGYPQPSYGGQLRYGPPVADQPDPSGPYPPPPPPPA